MSFIGERITRMWPGVQGSYPLETARNLFEDGRSSEHFLPFKEFGKDRAVMFEMVNMAGVYHLSSVVYRNKFGLNPPLCFADPYSCDVIINLVYGQFGDFYCIDEYMSEYRVHERGMFSQRRQDEIWCFHLYGYQRFFLYLGPKYWVVFANAVIIFATYVLSAYKKGLSGKLKLSTRFAFWVHLIAAQLVVHTVGLPSRLRGGSARIFHKGVELRQKRKEVQLEYKKKLRSLKERRVLLYHWIIGKLLEPVRRILRPIKNLIANYRFSQNRAIEKLRFW